MRMKFGIFLAPFHALGENPTLALERDFKLLELMDELGYDEAWIGEHHSAGWETIASPEVFIAAAAARTRHIKLGTGVISLPYHHPLILADRMVLLDHLTRGRIMFGVGPGALPSDAFMMGIDPQKQRDMMEESLEAIYELLTSDEPVNRETEWFTLKDARLQLRPYTHPHFEIAVAAQVSPSGPKLAGRMGFNLLSIGATSHSARIGSSPSCRAARTRPRPSSVMPFSRPFAPLRREGRRKTIGAFSSSGSGARTHAVRRPDLQVRHPPGLQSYVGRTFRSGIRRV